MEVHIPKSATVIADAFVFYWESIGRLFTKISPKIDSRICEANALRRAADRIKFKHPTFAKELYAAADRHERSVE